MSKMSLTASPPSTRTDGSAAAATDIASVTFQKVPNGGTAIQVLQTNTAATGAVLQASDLAFTDSSATAGDEYTCFFTDTHGTEGTVSNDVIAKAVAPPPLAPLSAGTLTGTFTA